jgi:hypothetical protein
MICLLCFIFFALVNCCQLFCYIIFFFVEHYSFAYDVSFYSKEQLEMKLLYAINADAGFDLSWLTYQLCDCMLCVEICGQISLIRVFGFYVSSRLEVSLTIKAWESKKVIKGWGEAN